MICCLKNFTPKTCSRIYFHNTCSANVGFFLFLRAKSFNRRYLSGEAVLNPIPNTFFLIHPSPPLSLPHREGRGGSGGF